jgi:hypothetical protein
MTKFGIIIAIEEYSSLNLSQFCNIEFALNDAQSIKKAFQEQLYVDDQHLIFLTNENANRANIIKEMANIFKTITRDDELYFYYVGHGFNSKAQNRITCWDTDNANLDETSLSLNEILLAPLKSSQIKKCFVFIDSSAEELKSKNKSKSAASNLVETEYSEIVRQIPGHAFFMSCYPGEKSFTSAQSKHGIWALHLLNAINGKDDDATDKEEAITNISLNKFLSAKIPQHITKNMFINDRQNPYAVIDENISLPLIKFETDEDESGKNVEIYFQQYVLSREQSIPYKNFKAFNKNRHKIPKDYSSFTSRLAFELAQEEFLKPEIENLFDIARKPLRLKNSNTVKDPEGGALHTDFFRYNINVDQSLIDFSEVIITRELELRVPLMNFPMSIDEIFNEGFDTITFPVKGSLDVDSIEDALYELEDDNHGTFEHKDNHFSFFPNNLKGIARVEISKNTLKIKFSSSSTPIAEILDYTQKTLVVMASTLKNLLC